jgi:hypothetical protein
MGKWGKLVPKEAAVEIREARARAEVKEAVAGPEVMAVMGYAQLI